MRGIINYSKSVIAALLSNMQEAFSRACRLQMINATKLHHLFSHHSFLLEVDPNGGYESGVEGAVGVLIEEARFTDAGIPERQELYQVIVIHSVVVASVEDPALSR